MNCLFCKIVAGEIPAKVVFENDNVIAFRDVNPRAPTHILIIPRKHIATIDDVEKQDIGLLGEMTWVAQQVARAEDIAEDGYRLVYNVKSDGGQEVYHIHLHLLGGRSMTWPPG